MATGTTESLGGYFNLQTDRRIYSGDDLNNYKGKFGAWFVSTDSDASGISNMPRAASGTYVRLHRGNPQSTYYDVEFYFPTSSPTTIYTRNYNAGTYTSWVLLVTDIFIHTGTVTTSAAGTASFTTTYNTNEYMCLSVTCTDAVSGYMLLPYKYGDAANGRWGLKLQNSGSGAAITNTQINYTAAMWKYA